MPKQIFKRIGNVFGGLILACCCLFGYYIMSVSSNKQLIDFKKDNGIVALKTEVARTSSTAKGPIQLKGFELNLKDNHKVFRYYNTSQDYALIDSNISIGDSLSIYYEQNNKDYVDLVQIEREGFEVIKLADFQRRNNIGRFIAFAGGILLVGMTIYGDSKHWRK